MYNNHIYNLLFYLRNIKTIRAIGAETLTPRRAFSSQWNARKTECFRLVVLNDNVDIIRLINKAHMTLKIFNLELYSLFFQFGSQDSKAPKIYLKYIIRQKKTKKIFKILLDSHSLIGTMVPPVLPPSFAAFWGKFQTFQKCRGTKLLKRTPDEVPKCLQKIFTDWGYWLPYSLCPQIGKRELKRLQGLPSISTFWETENVFLDLCAITATILLYRVCWKKKSNKMLIFTPGRTS